jgi:hypothetical protein
MTAGHYTNPTILGIEKIFRWQGGSGRKQLSKRQSRRLKILAVHASEDSKVVARRLLWRMW